MLHLESLENRILLSADIKEMLAGPMPLVFNQPTDPDWYNLLDTWDDPSDQYVSFELDDPALYPVKTGYPATTIPYEDILAMIDAGDEPNLNEVLSHHTVSITWNGEGTVIASPEIIGDNKDSFTFFLPGPLPDEGPNDFLDPLNPQDIVELDYRAELADGTIVGDSILNTITTEPETNKELWYKIDGHYGDIVDLSAIARTPLEPPDTSDNDDLLLPEELQLAGKPEWANTLLLGSSIFNNSPAPADFTVTYYFSENDSLDVDEDGILQTNDDGSPIDIMLNSFAASALPAGESHVEQTKVDLPAPGTFENGDYHIILVIDDLNVPDDGDPQTIGDYQFAYPLSVGDVPDTQVDIEVYNQYGTSFGSLADIENLDENGNIPALDMMLMDDGYYYIKITSDAAVYVGAALVDLEVVKTDSILVLDPGETADIEVFFTPKINADELTAELVFNISGEDAGNTTTDGVELFGASAPGDPTDLSLDSLEILNYVNPLNPGHEVNSPSLFFSGDEIEVSGSFTNNGPLKVYDNMYVSYYLTQNPDMIWNGIDDDGLPLNEGDLWLGEFLYEGPFEIDETFSFTETLNPTGIPDGDYHLTAVVNSHKSVNEDDASNNVQTSNQIAYVGSTILVLDSWEDSFDRQIAFESPVGVNSSPEYLYFINNTGGPLNLNGVSFTEEMGGKFSLLNDITTAPVVDFTMENAEEIAVGSFSKEKPFRVMAPTEYNIPMPYDPTPSFWYYFDAAAGDRIELISYNTEYVYIEDFEIYNEYGQPVAGGADLLSSEGREYIDSFIATYTGRYYISVDFSFLSSEPEPPVYQMLVNRAEQTGDFAVTEMTIPAQDETAVYSDALMRKNFIRQQMEQDIGVIEIVAPEGGSTAGEIIEFDVLAEDNLFISVFNADGIKILDKPYTQVGETETFKTVLMEEGTYTLTLATERAEYAFNPQTFEPFILTDELLPVNVDVSLRSLGNLNNLPDHTAVEIPVVFHPDRAENTEEARFDITNGATEPVTLDGTGLLGDLAVMDLSFPTLANPDLGPLTDIPPLFVQAGKELDVTTTYTNLGVGRILESTDIKYYLSADTIFDDPDIVPEDDPESYVPDTLLNITDPASAQTLADLPGAMNDFIPGFFFADPTNAIYFDTQSTVEIPSISEIFPAGDYYLIAVIDQADTIAETEADTETTNNAILSGPISIDTSPIIIYDSTGFSVEETLNKKLAFGKSAVDRSYPLERVSIFNRSDELVRVEDWTLNISDNFAVRVFDDPTNEPQTGEEIIFEELPYGREGGDLFIEPGTVRNIWVQFLPTETNPDNDNPYTLTDTLTIDQIYTIDDQGNETLVEETDVIDIEGVITGADLQFDIDVDKKLVVPATPVDTYSQTSFTLNNIGDISLQINNIFFVNPHSDFQMSLSPDDPDMAPTFPFLLGSATSDTASQTLNIYFNPSQAGTAVDTLVIQSTDKFGNKQQYTTTIDVMATGLLPELTISENDNDVYYDGVNDGQLQYGHRPFNSTTERILTLKNTGTGPASIDWIDLVKGDASAFDLALAGSDEPLQNIVVAAGEALDLIVSFNPVSDQPLTISYQDAIQIRLIDDDEPGNVVQESVQVRGIGTAPQINVINSNLNAIGNNDVLQLDTVSIDAQSSSATASDWFRIQADKVETYLNTILAPDNGFVLLGADLYSLDRDGKLQSPDGFEVLPDAAGNLVLDTVLEPGMPMDVFVAFVGDNVPAGNYEAPLQITGSLFEAYKINLAGKVVSPEIDLSETSFDFGTVIKDQVASLPLTISNDSLETNLVISNWTSSNEVFALDIDLTTPLVIEPGENVIVNVLFQPDDSIALNTLAQTTFNLTTNDLDESTVELQAIGRGSSIPFTNRSTFVDANGDLVTISLTEGSFVFFLEGGKRDAANIDTLVLSGTTDRSQLRIAVRGGTTEIATIKTSDLAYPPTIVPAQEAPSLASASLGTIFAPQVSITRQIDVNGSLSSLIVDDLDNNAAVNVQFPSAKPAMIKADHIGENVSINIAGQLGFLQASSYASGQVVAGEIHKVNLREDLGAHLTATGIDGNGSILQVVAREDITGNIRAAADIGVVASQRGGIAHNFIIAGDNALNEETAAAGSIRSISALKNISGTIIAEDEILSIAAKTGVFDGVVRADNLLSISADTFDNAILSIADNLNLVKARTEVVDSLFLAGYDIGTNTDLSNRYDLNQQDDSLSTGNIGKFIFGNKFNNSYVTAGAVTDYVLAELYSSLPSGQTNSSGSGSIGLFAGKSIAATGSEYPEFGLYAADSINSRLNSSDNFIVLENI